MTQPGVRRTPVPPWWVLVAIAALAVAVVAAVSVQALSQPGPSSTVADNPADAALLQLPPDGEANRPPVHSSFGGGDRWWLGTLTVPAPVNDVESQPRTYLYVAMRDGVGWTAAIEGTPAFERLARQARTAVVSGDVAELLTTTADGHSGDGSAMLSLPWAKGDEWRLTGGPHDYAGTSPRPLSSLDFAGPEPWVPARVRAARGGIVMRPCANLVQIRHRDGWTTSYYHLNRITVKAGQLVSRGQVLGFTSNASGCGGASTGPHVHFSLFRHGTPVDIAGHTIGGWTVEEGGSPYKGCMVREDERRCAPNGRIDNDGTIGAGFETRVVRILILGQ